MHKHQDLPSPSVSLVPCVESPTSNCHRPAGVLTAKHGWPPLTEDWSKVKAADTGHPPTLAVLIGREKSTVPIVGHLPQSKELALFLKRASVRQHAGLSVRQGRNWKLLISVWWIKTSSPQQADSSVMPPTLTWSVSLEEESHGGSGLTWCKIGDFGVKSQSFLSYRNLLLACVFSMSFDVNLFEWSGTLAHGIT